MRLRIRPKREVGRKIGGAVIMVRLLYGAAPTGNAMVM